MPFLFPEQPASRFESQGQAVAGREKRGGRRGEVNAKPFTASCEICLPLIVLSSVSMNNWHEKRARAVEDQKCQVAEEGEGFQIFFHVFSTPKHDSLVLHFLPFCGCFLTFLFSSFQTTGGHHPPGSRIMALSVETLIKVRTRSAMFSSKRARMREIFRPLDRK